MRDSVTQWLYASQQAPWRVQRQWLALLTLSVLLGITLASISLQASARAALLGREIQMLRGELSILERSNADLQVLLAAQTRVEVMEARARALGFRPPKPEEREYLIVPGYLSPAAVTYSSTLPLPMASLPPEYTQSLWDWLQERFASWMGGRP